MLSLVVLGGCGFDDIDSRSVCRVLVVYVGYWCVGVFSDVFHCLGSVDLFDVVLCGCVCGLLRVVNAVR